MPKISLLAAFLVASASLAGASLAAAAPVGSSCEAHGIFSSCRADCQPGQTPVCTAGFLGLSVSCTCIQLGGGASIAGSSLRIESAQWISHRGYLELLESFGSSEAAATAEIAVAMQDAADRNEYAEYEQLAVEHEETFNQLSPEEMVAVEEFVYGPGTVLP